eukprot:Em0007g819a
MPYLVDTETPGVFTLWALVGVDLYRLKLVVPRLFYVNCRSSKELQGEGTAWRKVSKVLPRSAPVLNLSEYTVSEEIFQEHAGELATQLSAPDIVGVYETQVPLLFRTIVTLGCVCMVNRNHTKKISAGHDRFELDQLEFKTVAQYPYLEGDSFKQLYLYHSSCDSRALFGLFIMATKKAHIFVLDRVRTNQMPTMTTVYENERAARLAKYENYPVPPQDFSYEIKIETEARRVYQGLQRVLSDYKDAKRGPTILFVQSPMEPRAMRSTLGATEDFPSVFIPSLDSDNSFPALDWQRVASKKMVQQFLNLQAWVHNQLEQSRYAHVPLGNLPRDPALFIADVFYARHLVKHGNVLWASPSDRPDLGGREDDDHRLTADMEEGSIEMNTPGTYPTCCVQLCLDGLAVNTVLQSTHINDYEGVTGGAISFDCAPQASLEELMEGGPSSLTVYDEAALCSSSFKILRGMVHAWLHEVSTNQNYYADLQLQHFYRWIRSPSSLLYEPGLCRIIHKLMKKLFMQLVGEFRRLGSTIVYADFSKIVVCTKKGRMEDACAYIQFILKSIKSRDFFHSIQIEPDACWECLWWMDQANYGGISMKVPRQLSMLFSDDDAKDENDEKEEEEEVSVEREVEMRWDICKYLPEAASCQDLFRFGLTNLVHYVSVSSLAGHIHALYMHEKAERESRTQASTPVVKRKQNSTQTQIPADSSVTASLVTFAQQRIERELTEKLFVITQKIHQTLGGGESSNKNSSDVFPSLPGSHLTFNNPALEFVKDVCKVLSLDSVHTTSSSKAKTRPIEAHWGEGVLSRGHFPGPLQELCTSLR